MANYTSAPNMTPSPNMTPMSWWMFTPAPMAQKPKVNLFDFDKPAPFAWWLPQMQQRVPKITATPQQLQRGWQIIEKEKEIKELTGMWATEYEKVKSEKKLSYEQAQRFAKADGISVQEAVKWFAEKGYSVGRQSFWSHMKESAQQFIAPSAWFVWGALDVVWNAARIPANIASMPAQYLAKQAVKATGWDPKKVNFMIPKNIGSKASDYLVGDQKDTATYGITKELWKVAASAVATAPIWWLWAIGAAKTAGNVIKTWKAIATWQKLSRLQKAWQIGKQMWLWAAEGIAWNALYNIWSDQHALQHVGTAGLLGAAIPGGSAAVAGIRKWLWKTAESMAVKWLLNAKSAQKVQNALAETADSDIAIWRWALDRWVAGKSTQEGIERLRDIKNTNYKEVRDVVDAITDRYKDVPSVKESMQMSIAKAKRAKKVAGRELDDIAEMEGILARNNSWKLTLPDVQRSKEIIDKNVRGWTKSGDEMSGDLATAGRDTRERLRSFIESEVERKTWGKVNIRELNREVAVATELMEWMKAKSISNALKQFAIQWGIGWVSAGFAWPSPLQNPIWFIGTVIAWSILWRAAGATLWNPKVMWKIAKILDSMSDGTRKEILEYAKDWGKKYISQEAIDQLVRVREEAERIPEISTAMRLVREGKMQKWFTVPEGSLIQGKLWALKSPGSTNTLKEINKVPTNIKEIPVNVEAKSKDLTNVPKKSIIKNIDGFKDVVSTYKSKSDFIKDFKKMWQGDPFQEWKMKSFAIDKALISNKLDTKYKWYKSIDDALSAMYDDLK